jgi:hypothetical protein
MVHRLIAVPRTKGRLGAFCRENAKPPYPRPAYINASDVPRHGVGADEGVAAMVYVGEGLIVLRTAKVLRFGGIPGGNFTTKRCAPEREYQKVKRNVCTENLNASVAVMKSAQDGT